MVRSRHSKSADFLNGLNDQVIPSMDIFIPDGSGVFQDDNAKIPQVLVVNEWSMRSISVRELFSHMNWPAQSPDYNPIESIWDVLEKTEGMV